MTKASVLSVAFNFINFTGEIDDKGQVVQRTTYPKAYYNGFTSLKVKLLKSVIVTVKDGEATKELTIEEFGKEDPKPEVVSEKFTDSDIELTDSEKKALKAAVDVRDELVALDEETTKAFTDWSGVEYGR